MASALMFNPNATPITVDVAGHVCAAGDWWQGNTSDPVTAALLAATTPDGRPLLITVGA